MAPVEVAAEGTSGRVPAKPAVTQWVERFRPKHLGEVVGNIDQVRKLAEWLRDWDDVVLHGKTKEPPVDSKRPGLQKFAAAPENINARAALISGPPGIGKTTTCSLVARCSKRYQLMEYNASDARSKAVIDSMSQSLAGNRTLKASKTGGSALERAVIIMDECDGMAGGDKGGIQALISMIKSTRNPIICICNDRGDQGIRNLAAHCYDIKFRRPENAAVAKRVQGIVRKDGLKVDLSAVEAVVEACGQDIRQVINQVQFFGSVAVRGKSSQKDLQNMMSPYDVCTKLLTAPQRGTDPLPMERKLDMYYVDADFVPLMIQENYLRSLEGRKQSSEDGWLEHAARAAELISIADTMAGNWEVQSSSAVIGTVYPAFLAASDENFSRPSFPSFFQKQSAKTKGERLANEMHSRMKVATTCGLRDVVASGYHELLHHKLLRPLLIGGARECALALQAHGLAREFFTEQSPALRGPLQLEDGYKKVDGKVKHNLLNELQSLLQQSATVRKRKRHNDEDQACARGGGARGGTGEDGDADDGEGEEAGGEEADNGLVKKKKINPKSTKVAPQKPSGKAGKGDASKSSLSGWMPKKARLDQEGTESQITASQQKKASLVLQFTEGHTNAVRRKVHMKELLGPWLGF